jgi:hypothetical protein
MAAEVMTLTDPTLISGITNLCLKSTVQIVFWPSNDWHCQVFFHKCTYCMPYVLHIPFQD